MVTVAPSGHGLGDRVATIRPARTRVDAAHRDKCLGRIGTAVRCADRAVSGCCGLEAWLPRGRDARWAATSQPGLGTGWDVAAVPPQRTMTLTSDFSQAPGLDFGSGVGAQPLVRAHLTRTTAQ